MLTRSCWDPPVPPEAQIWSVGSGSVTGDWATRYPQYETVPDGVVLTAPANLARSKRNKLKAKQRAMSMTANAQTLRAWREANPEKYAAQKQRQYKKRVVGDVVRDLAAGSLGKIRTPHE